MHLVSHQVQSNGSKGLQMALNYFKWLQMTIAKATGYVNSPTLFQRTPHGPK